MEKYIPGRVGVCAGSYMLKWPLLNQHVHNHPMKLFPGDRINVFINLEGVLKNLFLQRGLTDMILSHKQNVVIEMESAIMNLMASYRSYFVKEKCIPKMYFYVTDLGENPQQMEIYNKDYRSYYRNKYMQDPHFSKMGDLMQKIIIPEVKLILTYIPDCYLISTKTFDSSVVPKVIGSLDDSKNVIISGDLFDTLYMFDDFMVIYIKRRFQHFSVTSCIADTIPTIIKNESLFDMNIFGSEMYYRLLMSIHGSKIRNIRSAKGFGYGRFMRILKDGIEQGRILKDFESIDSIIDMFPEAYREDIKNAFQCTSIDTQYGLLNETDIEEIKSQIIDKADIKSVEALNNKRFLDDPINLPALLN